AYFRVFFCALALVGGALFGDQRLLRVGKLGTFQQADHRQVLLDDVAELGHDRGHVYAAGLEVAAARIEYGLQFFHKEGDVAALAEHGGHDARQRHDPLEVVHVLRVDEDLEGAAHLEFGAGVQHDVVDGDVHRVLDQRRSDLVGGPDQDLRTLELLVHLDDLELARLRRCGLRGGGLRFRHRFRFVAEDLVALDLLVDAGGHAVRSCAGLRRLVQKKATPARLGPASRVLRYYFFLRRALFLAAFFAPPFLAAFFVVFFAAFRAPPFFAAFLAPPFFTALRAPFLTALRVVFLATLRAPFLTALRAVFLAALRAPFFAAFFTAFLAAGFLAAFFFFAGFLAAGLAAAGAGAAGAAAGSSVMLHGNVVSLLIGCSSGWIVDSGPLVALQERRRASPWNDSMRSSMIAAAFFLRSSLIAASTNISLKPASSGTSRQLGHPCPDFSRKRLRRRMRTRVRTSRSNPLSGHRTGWRRCGFRRRIRLPRCPSPRPRCRLPARSDRWC